MKPHIKVSAIWKHTFGRANVRVYYACGIPGQDVYGFGVTMREAYESWARACGVKQDERD